MYDASNDAPSRECVIGGIGQRMRKEGVRVGSGKLDRRQRAADCQGVTKEPCAITPKGDKAVWHSVPSQTDPSDLADTA